MASSARIDELRKKFDENPRRYFAPLANEFRKAGDLEQAVFICQEYLPQQPGHMSGHIVYGQALFELGRDEEAKAVFETALSLDPENLIALRHLGDIARQAGDLDVARFWYQRVLESDPRNEEITQLLLSLDEARGQAPPPISHAPVAPPEVPATAPQEPVPAPTVSVEPSEPVPAVEASDEPQSYEPFEGFDRTIDFDQVGNEPAVEVETPLAEAAAAEPAVPVAQPEEHAMASAQAPVPDAEELLDLDDFSIGGETSHADATEAEISPEALSEASTGSPAADLGEAGVISTTDYPELQVSESATASASVDDVSMDDVSMDEDVLADTGEGRVAFEPETGSPASLETVIVPDTPPEPVIELAGDLELGLPSDEPASPAEYAAVEPPAVPTADEEQRPDSGDEVFVTETMANLYVQQGHLANALEIYEKLAANNPDDTKLQEQIRDVKARIYGKPRESIWEPEAVAADFPSSPAAAGTEPSIRDFLRNLIARRTEASSNGTAHEPEREVASSESMPPEVLPSESVTGSIDALFTNAAPSDEDHSAANALAQAFGEWPEPTPIRGIPAHEASSELSLDHVFKANAPVPRREDQDSFSFDQFFSEAPGDEPSGNDDQPGPGSAETSDDIAQFNAWLNGLKKT